MVPQSYRIRPCCSAIQLGPVFADGTGVARDEKQAVEWYRKAIESGHAAAQFNLGLCLQTALELQGMRNKQSNGTAKLSNQAMLQRNSTWACVCRRHWSCKG